MQKNLISAIAGWKSAALLALVAMVATVAFSGVLTNTQGATAQTAVPLYSVTIAVGGSGTITIPDTGAAGTDATTAALTGAGAGITSSHTADDTADDADDADDTVTISVAETVYPGSYTLTFDANVTDDAATTDVNEAQIAVTVVGKSVNPGDTVEVSFPAGLGTPNNRFTIGSDSTATGLFADAPTRARPVIDCADDTAGSGDPTTCDRDVASGTIAVRVAVARDSAVGKIYVSPAGTTGEAEHIINVVAAQVATGMTLTPPVLGISSNAGGDGSTITINVTDNRGQAVDGQAVQLATTRGQFVNCGTPAVTLPVCNVVTAADGTATVTLRGDNRPGPATVTATAGTLTRSAAVTFFGLADSLTAAAAGGVATVDQGKSSFVFLTVTDKDGNAVQGSTPGSSVTTEIENPTVVTLDGSAAYEGNPATPADDVPACTAGTNVAGKCAVQISAGPTASRGIHTVAASMVVTTATGPKVLSDTIDIRVVGAPASVTTDAPESVEPRTTVTINISVSDDAGELVGGGTVKVLKLEGRGAVLGTDDDDNATLVGGKASFRYYATSTDTAAVFEVTAGAGPAAVTEIVEIVVSADAAMDDDMSMATWNQPLASGTHNLVWNGEDGADPSAGAEGVSAIWQWNGSSWDGYFPMAADVPGGNTLTSLSNGAAYWVIVE